MKSIGFISAIFLVGGMSNAFAASFCVSDSAGLQAAFDEASSNGEDDDIRLETGVYTPTGNSFVFSSADLHAVSIGGGYQSPDGLPACSVSLGGAQRTVLDGVGTKRLLDVNVSGASAAPVLVHDLTFYNAVSISSTAPITMGGSADWIGSLTLENISARGNHTDFLVAQVGASGGIFVRNSEFVANISDAASGVILGLNSGLAGSGTSILFNNNSVSGNAVPATSTRAGVAFSSSGPGDVRIANSIFWNNGGSDIQLATAGPVFLDHDDIGVRTVFGGVVVNETVPYHVDPGFVAVDDLRLAPASPLRDVGQTTAEGGTGSIDVRGNPRVAFGIIDIGAHEFPDEIFKDGFD